MRHLRSVVYALVLAPAVWILCGVGFDQDLTGRARDNGGLESVSGVLLLLLAGAAYAILLLTPISPAGPLLAGLAFLGIGAWARAAPDSYAGVWPPNVAQDGFDMSTPGYGLAVLLAVPLLATALSARRWRRYEAPEIVLLGTVGRARGTVPAPGTPMAAERTAAIPQQRQASGYGGPSAEATQYLGTTADRTVAVPPQPADDDGDEKTTVMQLGRPAVPVPGAPVPGAPVSSSPSDGGEVGGADADRTAYLSVPDDSPTRDVTGDDETRDIAAGETTQSVVAGEVTQSVAPDEVTQSVAAGDSTRDLTADAATREVTAAETTHDVTGGETTHDVAAHDATEDVTGGETTSDVTGGEATRDIAAGATTQNVRAGEVTQDVAADEPTPTAETTREVTGGETTREVADRAVTQDVTADEPSPSPTAEATHDVTGDAASRDRSGGETTRLVFGAAQHSSPADGTVDDSDRTQVLRLPATAANAADAGSANSGERTQLIRTGTVEPPGDRTQVLRFGSSGDAATDDSAAEGRDSTRGMSIVAAERPDPGEDPTTRLSVAARDPGAATTRANPVARPTVSSLERPADEAADDETRPLVLPTQRTPPEDDVTRRL